MMLMGNLRQEAIEHLMLALFAAAAAIASTTATLLARHAVPSHTG